MTHTSSLRLSGLLTEQINPDYENIDRSSVAELIRVMNQADATVPQAIWAVREQITAAIQAISTSMAAGGRLFYVGAGTAGRLGVLDAAECGPTFDTPPELVQAILAGGPAAVTEPVEGAEDDPEGGAQAVAQRGIRVGDVLVGIAASGRTPFVMGALAAAKQLGVITVSLACTADSAIGTISDHPIEVLTGPEVIAGSTRLKAGTAQKLVLNMMSTISMVQQGRTYGNLMVDLRPTNDKLRERSLGIVQQITGLDRAAAQTAMELAGNDVKLAALISLRELDLAQARELLLAHHGRLRAALEESR